jgi:hypothetical protein
MKSFPADNPLVEIDVHGQEFHAIDRYHPFAPILLSDLMVLMEGNLKENAEIIIKAFSKGKLKLIH